MEAENQAAQRLPVNYQAIINASTGVNVATRSAAESASVFEQALGVQSQRAQEVRARMQQLEEQQRGSVAMTGQQRQAMIVVGEQFRQVGTEVALGIPAMQIFAQQSGKPFRLYPWQRMRVARWPPFSDQAWASPLLPRCCHRPFDCQHDRTRSAE
jgi:hypothetical protein